jgi:BON domain-containing protein
MLDLRHVSHVKARLWQWTLCAALSFCPGVLLASQAGFQFPQSKPSISDPNAPNTKPAEHQKTSAKDVEENLRKGFDSKNAAYAGSDIQAVVDDQSVTLTGTVKSESQREMALQLAQAYAGNRKIVDRLVVPQ